MNEPSRSGSRGGSSAEDCSPTPRMRSARRRDHSSSSEACQQFCDIATGYGSFVGIAGAERDNVASKIGANGAAEQLN